MQKKKVKERFDKMKNIGTFSYAPAEIDGFGDIVVERQQAYLIIKK